MNKKIAFALLFVLLIALCFASCNKKCEHDYVETVFSPTCKENGFTQKLCKKCGDEILSDFVPRSTHDGEWQIKKEPTCETVGTEEKICTTCNVSYDTRTISKLGHISGEWKTIKAPTCKDEGMEKLFCNVCGTHLETNALEPTDEHSFRTEVILPTVENEGYTNYTCKVCNFTKKDDYVSKIEAPSTPEKLTSNEIYQLVFKSTVRIDAYDKNGNSYALGSGFFISDDGKIATNYHVIQGAYALKVTLYSDNSQHNVTSVLGYNSAQDVAVIQIDLKNTAALELSNDPVSVGDDVYALGCPMGFDNIFTSGFVSNQSVKVAGIDCIAFTTPISPGNSGGPLVNGKGQVVGINSMRITDAENFNLAVKINQITTLDTSKHLTTSELYVKTLAENAFDIFCVDLMFNAQAIQGDEYIIYESVAETPNSYGLEIYYIYNAETAVFTERIYLVQEAKRVYCAELKISQVAEKYSFTLYDVAMGQHSVEAKINVKNPCVSFENDFESLFKMITFRYVRGGDDSPEAMKQLCFEIYVVMVSNLKSYLDESNTGLTISHFNFNFN